MLLCNSAIICVIATGLYNQIFKKNLKKEMLTRYFPFPVKLVCGFIYTQEELYLKAKAVLERKFGRIDFESQVIPFTFTNYYYKEMGEPLFRRFVAFTRLKKIDDFVAIKLFCMRVEHKFASRSRRTVNIDPGYLNEAKFVLITTKDFYHRLYLGRGIYAEVTLYYSDGDLRDFPTTYPDYRSLSYKKILLAIRNRYQSQIRGPSL